MLTKSRRTLKRAVSLLIFFGVLFAYVLPVFREATRTSLVSDHNDLVLGIQRTLEARESVISSPEVFVASFRKEYGTLLTKRDLLVGYRSGKNGEPQQVLTTVVILGAPGNGRVNVMPEAELASALLAYRPPWMGFLSSDDQPVSIVFNEGLIRVNGAAKAARLLQSPKPWPLKSKPSLGETLGLPAHPPDAAVIKG